MALISFKMAASLVVAAVLLLATTPQVARGCALLEDDEVMPADMVPEVKPAEQVLVAIPGAAGSIMAASSLCLQCRCCFKSNPKTCKTTTCCSSFKCDRAGKCSLVHDKCGCSGCGGAN